MTQSAAPLQAAVTFDALPGWETDDLAEAFRCFRKSAEALVSAGSVLRPALPTPAPLLRVARLALAAGPNLANADARRFFEHFFVPVRLGHGDATAFFTGYYEPIVEGSLEPNAQFTAAILGRPPDLRTFAADDARPGALAGLTAARGNADGSLVPYPSRAEIEAQDPLRAYRPVVWLRDPVEVFMIHVQGSARVRLADGRVLRLTYAGRNGHPYTSIGRILVEEGAMAADAMSLDALKGWLRAHGLEPGQEARSIMQRNASYIFFEGALDDSDQGPVGGEGIPLTPLRSIAVDRALWSYGVPFWIDATLPWQSPEPSRMRRLMIAQDTGSAILGTARADIFLGCGDAAGRLAGGIRHRGSFIVLQPRPQGDAPP